MCEVFMLVASDLSQLGGPMGTERVSTLFRSFHRSQDGAKARAVSHYNSRRRSQIDQEISWREIRVSSNGNMGITSGDLGWVMYDIRKVDIED